MLRTTHAPSLRRALGFALAVALVAPLAACAPPVPLGSTGTGASSDASKAIEEAAAKADVILASATSPQDSGLLDVLIPAFQRDDPRYLMKVFAVGSTQALTLGKKKNVDVLLVDSPTAELPFVDGGFGTERRPVMYSECLIVGPDRGSSAHQGPQAR